MNRDVEKQILTEAWKRSIALLRKDLEIVPDQSSLQRLIKTADDFSIKVEIDGDIPAQTATEQLILEAASEALTNAVRHAGAQTLYICFSETSTHYQVSFQNDGRLPAGEITEGGGLTSLRRKVEAAGGSMSICCHPAYALTIAISKEGGEHI